MRKIKKHRKCKITSFSNYRILRSTFNEGPLFFSAMEPFISYSKEKDVELTPFHKSINQKQYTNLLNSYLDNENMSVFNKQNLNKRVLSSKANGTDRDVMCGCFIHENPSCFKKHVLEFAKKNNISIKEDFINKIECASQSSKNNHTSSLLTNQEDQFDFQPFQNAQFNNKNQNQIDFKPFLIDQSNYKSQDQIDFKPSLIDQSNTTSQSQNASQPFPTVQFSNTSQNQNNNNNSFQTALFDDSGKDQNNDQLFSFSDMDQESSNDYDQDIDFIWKL